MATYKVLQDIEAEDHILGSLSLRQFIYALISVFLLYVNFLLLTKHVGFLMILFLPPAIFTGFFAVPFGRDQPTEVWALAKIRFLFKPRKRLWDQSGIKELVTITVPKTIERVLTDGLSQTEVNSRLKALANTIDSRGWAVKNVNVNMYGQPNPLVATVSDRLIDINNIPQDVPSYDVQAADDILDETSNPIAQQFDQMINASTQAHHRELVEQMNQAPAVAAEPTPAPTNWFMQAPTPAMATPAPVAPTAPAVAAPVTAVATQGGVPVAQEASADEMAIAQEIKKHSASQQVSYGHLRTLQPLSAAAPAATPPAATASPAAPDPAILSLANNNDLNVATLAREAHKAKDSESPDGEVVISLH